MQMRSNPDVIRFAYPSSIKPAVLGARMQHFVHIRVIFLVQGAMNLSYCDILAQDELCAVIGRHL